MSQSVCKNKSPFCRPRIRGQTEWNGEREKNCLHTNNRKYFPIGFGFALRKSNGANRQTTKSNSNPKWIRKCLTFLLIGRPRDGMMHWLVHFWWQSGGVVLWIDVGLLYWIMTSRTNGGMGSDRFRFETSKRRAWLGDFGRTSVADEGLKKKNNEKHHYLHPKPHSPLEESGREGSFMSSSNELRWQTATLWKGERRGPMGEWRVGMQHKNSPIYAGPPFGPTSRDETGFHCDELTRTGRTIRRWRRLVLHGVRFVFPTALGVKS